MICCTCKNNNHFILVNQFFIPDYSLHFGDEAPPPKKKCAMKFKEIPCSFKCPMHLLKVLNPWGSIKLHWARSIHHRNLTWNLKHNDFQKSPLPKVSIFKFHDKLWGCKFCLKSSTKNPKKKHPWFFRSRFVKRHGRNQTFKPWKVWLESGKKLVQWKTICAQIVNSVVGNPTKLKYCINKSSRHNTWRSHPFFGLYNTMKTATVQSVEQNEFKPSSAQVA